MCYNKYMTNLWLDDVREAPEGWTWVKTYEKCLAVLKSEKVEVLSLDNDLGGGIGSARFPMFGHGSFDEPEKEGSDVADWLEENSYWPRVVCVHTANPYARDYIRKVFDNSGKYHNALWGKVGKFDALVFNKRVLLPEEPWDAWD